MVASLTCPIGSQLKVYCVLSKEEAKCRLEPVETSTEHNTLAKSMTAKNLRVDAWIQSMISLRLDMGASMCENMH